MSNLTRPYRNGSNGSHHNPTDVEFYALDDKLRNEMKRLAEVNTELLGKLNSDPEVQLPEVPLPEVVRPEVSLFPVSSGLSEKEQNNEDLLLEENARLRRRLAETEQLLEQAVAHEESWLDRQREYEALLDEKSEVIRSLHLKVKDLQEKSAPAATLASSTAMAAPGQPLEDPVLRRMKEELEEERRQLKQDEESLMEQMRQMEMAMSRDRAELARQRNDMQRLQAELNHEIEMASRDPQLRDRLLALQRRQQDSMARKGGAASVPQPEHQPGAPEETSQKKSGFFSRLFG